MAQLRNLEASRKGRVEEQGGYQWWCGGEEGWGKGEGNCCGTVLESGGKQKGQGGGARGKVMGWQEEGWGRVEGACCSCGAAPESGGKQKGKRGREEVMGWGWRYRWAGRATAVAQLWSPDVVNRRAAG